MKRSEQRDNSGVDHRRGEARAKHLFESILALAGLKTGAAHVPDQDMLVVAWAGDALLTCALGNLADPELRRDLTRAIASDLEGSVEAHAAEVENLRAADG